MESIQKWCTAWALADMNNFRLGLHIGGNHPKRGPETSFDGVTGFYRDRPADRREVRIEANPLAPDTVHLFIIEGGSEDRLTMTRASLGSETSDVGLFPALRAILGDPPGWAPGGGPPPSSQPPLTTLAKPSHADNDNGAAPRALDMAPIGVFTASEPSKRKAGSE